MLHEVERDDEQLHHSTASSTSASPARPSSRLKYLSDVLSPSSMKAPNVAAHHNQVRVPVEEEGRYPITDGLDTDDGRKKIEQLKSDRQERQSQQVQESVMRSISLAATRAAQAHGSLDKQRAVWLAAGSGGARQGL